MATSMSMNRKASMNHNENEIVEEMINENFHRFVNVEHENLSNGMDEDEHVEQDERVVDEFLCPNLSLSNDANDIHHHNSSMDI